jgi:ABC-2 type transport system permease protein/lipopolysaccharide transport system permease protein
MMKMSDNQSSLTVFDAAEHRGLRNILARNVRDLVTYRFAIYNFIDSTLRERYRRSALGFLWNLLNPLMTMTILAIVFSAIFKSPINNFAIYIFSGLLPWTLISNSINFGSMSLVHAEGYLKKVYVPKFMFPLVTVGVEVVNFLLSLVSLFVLALVLGAQISPALLTLPLALLLTAFFVLGLVLVASMLTVYFRDLAYILQIGFMGLFYLTPIVYPVQLLEGNQLLLTIIKLNPFFYFVELFHRIIYEARMPEGSLWLICLGLAGLSMIAGFLIFSARERDFIYRL